MLLQEKWSDSKNFPVIGLQKIVVAESISGTKFTNESRINALTAHAQTLLSKSGRKRAPDMTAFLQKRRAR